MADGQPSIASAVIAPEPIEPLGSPVSSSKRRQSSVSEHESKRPRLSTGDADDTARRASVEDGPSGPNGTSRSPQQNGQRKPSGGINKVEERKRGQRLFGGLIGALSREPSTAAQRRRADAEKKQQEKLKLQVEELDERKKNDLSKLKARRRREQIVYEEEALRTRHTTLFTLANFLRTSAEPALYYKPWKLLRIEEDRIESQQADIKAAVNKEMEEFVDRRQELTKNADEADQQAEEPPPVATDGARDINGSMSRDTGQNGDSATKVDVSEVQERSQLPPGGAQTVRPESPGNVEDGDAGDGGEEVMEGGEETVIY